MRWPFARRATRRPTRCHRRTPSTTGRTRSPRCQPSPDHLWIEEEDHPHEDDVAEDDEDRPEDDAARGCVADAFGPSARGEAEIAGSHRDEEAEYRGLER